MKNRKFEHVQTFLISAASALATPTVFGLAPPLWFQPCAVGLVWGSLFLLGVVLGSTAIHRLGPMIVASAAAVWLSVASSSLTDFSMRESLIFCALLLVAGWMVTRAGLQSASLHGLETRLHSRRQWSIVDLMFWMTSAALIVSGLTHTTAPLPLWIGAGGTLLIGCCFSWAACQLAWNDSRPVGLPLLAGVVFSAIGVFVVARFSPLAEKGQLGEWIVSGPASVVASQVFIVLLSFGMSRRDFFKTESTSANMGALFFRTRFLDSQGQCLKNSSVPIVGQPNGSRNLPSGCPGRTISEHGPDTLSRFPRSL